eukprot:631362-Pyramimonas_sp.AAC.1
MGRGPLLARYGLTVDSLPFWEQEAARRGAGVEEDLRSVSWAPPALVLSYLILPPPPPPPAAPPPPRQTSVFRGIWESMGRAEGGRSSEH